jgi:hypothetical protein
MEYFPKENFLLLKSSELKNNLDQTLASVSTFLQITSVSKPANLIESNKAAPVKSKGLQQFLLNRNHPLRIMLRPVIKPLKYLINNSGIINLLYKINKSEKEYAPLTKEERNAAMLYFEEDLKNLKKEFNISFSE